MPYDIFQNNYKVKFGGSHQEINSLAIQKCTKKYSHKKKKKKCTKKYLMVHVGQANRVHVLRLNQRCNMRVEIIGRRL